MGFSGGIEVRFFGGEMDSKTSLLYRRYRVFGKFHQNFSNFSMYISPLFGLESTDISQLRKEWRNRSNGSGEEKSSVIADSTEEVSDCEKMFSLDGFSAGLEGGAGFAFSKYIGAFASAQYEYNFSRSQLLTLTPGLGLNLRNLFDWANKNTYSLWITVEGGFQRYFNRGVPDWNKSVILGFILGV